MLTSNTNNKISSQQNKKNSLLNNNSPNNYITLALYSSHIIKISLTFTHHTCVHMPAHGLTPATVNPEGYFYPCMCPSACTSSMQAGAFGCVSKCGVILSSAHCGLRAEPTWCDICEGREIIYMTLLLIGVEILI